MEILDVCDAVVDSLAEFWPHAVPNAIQREYIPDLADVDADVRPEGRKVYVYPDRSGQVEGGTRSQDLNEHSVIVAVWEYFDGADVPPKEWLDERTRFVHCLWKFLGDVRAAKPVVPDAWPETAEVDPWFDPETLVVDRAFYAEIRVSYREYS